MDTEKQRQRRRDGARLTESGNARSEQLLVVPTESLTNRQQLLHSPIATVPEVHVCLYKFIY